MPVKSCCRSLTTMCMRLHREWAGGSEVENNFVRLQ